jgi:hypothetical protein
MLPAGYETDRVLQLETNLDDLSPEVLGYVTQQLLEAGALDVWVCPIQMKKQRPGSLLGLLCEESLSQKLADLIFNQTSAFGLRITEVTRLKLQRDFIEVATEFGPVSMKRGFRGQELLRCTPEYESCRAAAERHQVPLQAVYDAAKAEWQLSRTCETQPSGPTLG